MKKKLFLLGMLGIALTFGLAVAGCGDGGGGGGGGDPELSGTVSITGTAKWNQSLGVK